MSSGPVPAGFVCLGRSLCFPRRAPTQMRWESCHQRMPENIKFKFNRPSVVQKSLGVSDGWVASVASGLLSLAAICRVPVARRTGFLLGRESSTDVSQSPPRVHVALGYVRVDVKVIFRSHVGEFWSMAGMACLAWQLS